MKDLATQLSPKQIRALNALMAGATQNQAAKKAGVAVDTIQYWIYTQQDFKAAYAEARRALFQEVNHKTPQTLVKAAELLTEIFEFGERPDETRRPDLAVKLLQSVFSKGNVINVIQSNDHSQNISLNGNGPAPPLDANRLDPSAVGAFVEALRNATITIERQAGNGGRNGAKTR